jgi:dolichol-phosphate mannosyltransferase
VKLSVLIPVYNEAATIDEILRLVAAEKTPKEILVVDDGSTDGTREKLRAWDGKDGVRVILHDRNLGKGRAVSTAMEAATGDVLIIQDADLEYDPNDYVPMLEALRAGRGDVVYGSRYLGRGRHPNQSLAAYLGGRSLSLAALILAGRYLTDTVTALKLFHRDQLATLTLETSGFELDHEITAKMAQRGARIVEVPIHYAPRSREEGKKIGLRDWFIAVRTFLRYRNG